MTLTNHSNLPQAIVKLVSGGEREHQPNSISVTTALKPPQIVALEKMYAHEIVEDAADRIWMTYGTIVHLALERMGTDNALTEERLTAPVEGWTYHGTPDLYEADGTLWDFKFASVWSHISGPTDDDIAQLNCYAWLLREHGFPVEKAQILALYRDWSKTRAFDDGYPQKQAEVLSVPLWPHTMVGAFIASRVRLHQAGAEGAYGECTPIERWERPTQWAVTKKGNKRASRLLDSEPEALEWALTNMPRLYKYEITERPGESVRCESYCRVASKCRQWAAMKGREDESRSSAGVSAESIDKADEVWSLS